MRVFWRYSTVVLFSSVALLALGLQRALACDDSNVPEPHWVLGVGKADVTGPALGVVMMGYVDPQQKSSGIHMRQWSRAFVLEEPCDGDRVAIAVVDVAQIFGNVKQRVISRLQELLPGVYDQHNTIVTATHTHNGPGGYAGRWMYNLTSSGPQRDSVEPLVEGIAQSIAAAHESRIESRVWMHQSSLSGAGFNRSEPAYRANPQEEREAYGGDVDEEFVLLRFENTAGEPLGSVNWFAVHPVSLSALVSVISGDNKGLAAYLFEKRFQEIGREGFVGAFAQSNSGDVSPYPVTGPQEDDFVRNKRNAVLQFEKATESWENAETELNPRLEMVSVAVDMSSYQFQAKHLPGPVSTCSSALGVAFAAGTENGSPFPLFNEGTVYGDNWPKITLLPALQKCHGAKPILLPTGIMPTPWTDNVLPFQLLRIGNVVIAAIPSEINTMAGRRLRAALTAVFENSGVENPTVVLAALSNAFAHYVATPEEYSMQHYEGASTLYGEHTLDAFIDIFERLAGDLLGEPHGLPVVELPPWEETEIELRVFVDRLPDGAVFGEVIDQPQVAVARGNKAVARFWSAHPRQNFRSRDSFVSVQRLAGESWLEVWSDNDPDTIVQWNRDRRKRTQAEIEWHVSAETLPGSYRICHSGWSRLKRQAQPSSFTGCTLPFAIE